MTQIFKGITKEQEKRAIEVSVFIIMVICCLFGGIAVATMIVG